MIIGNHDTEKSVLVIAEIGNNHEGNYALAEEMIGQAAEAGAGAVKFQTYQTEHLVSKDNEGRFDQLKSFEFGFAAFEKLAKVAESEGVLFISTPFDIQSAEFLDTLVPAFKIASGDNTFYPLLSAVARFAKPILLSGGLASMNQLRFAKAHIDRIWEENGIDSELAVLHCVTGYPVPDGQANLKAVRQLQTELQCPVGYSDHTLGIEAAVLAVALGARIIEKHFTLDKNTSDFHDHQIAANPDDLRNLIQRIQLAEVLLGSGAKTIQDCEKQNLKAVRRSMVAARDIAAGETIRFEDISWIRPGGGIPPGCEEQILGKIATVRIQQGELFTPESLK